MNTRVHEGEGSLPENRQGRKQVRPSAALGAALSASNGCGTSFELLGDNVGKSVVSARRWDEFRLVNYINGCGL